MVKDKNIDKLLKIISKYKNIDKVILFGSRARGDNDERADIDIAIDCPKISEANFYKLMEEMDSSTILKLDIHRFDKLEDGKFKDRIIQEGKRLL